MTLEEYAKDQLGYTYDRIAADQETRSKIKTWCVTVWVGSLAAVSNGHFTISGAPKMALPVLPILLFWLLDGMYQSYIAGHCAHARTLERMLIGVDPMTSEALLTVSVESGAGRNPRVGVLRKIFNACFQLKTIWVFYTVLLALTGLLYIATK